MAVDTGTHPIPSKNSEVAARNLEDLDKIVNDISTVNRAGNALPSVSETLSTLDAAATAGLSDIQDDVDAVNASADAFDANTIARLAILESNYLFTALNGGIWAAGQTFTAFNQYMVFGGVAYKPDVNVMVLPYVSLASPVGDANVVPFTDQTVQNDDLSQSYTFKTIALMKASLVEFPEGKKIFWQGYHAESDGGSNWGIVKSGAHTEDGGSIFTLADGKYIDANMKGKKTTFAKFGLSSSVVDNSDSIESALSFVLVSGQPIYIPEVTAGYTRAINFSQGTFNVKGAGFDKSVLVFNGAGEAIRGFSNNSSFEKFRVNAGSGAHTYGWYADADVILGFGVQNTRFQEIYIDGFNDASSYGFYLAMCWKLTLDRVRVSNGVNGINIGKTGGAANDITLASCDTAQNSGIGLNISKGSANRVIGGNFAGIADAGVAETIGIQLTDANQTTVIKGPYIENCKTGINIINGRSADISGVFVNGFANTVGVKLLAARQGTVKDIFLQVGATVLQAGDGAGSDPVATEVSGLNNFDGVEYDDQLTTGSVNFPIYNNQTTPVVLKQFTTSANTGESVDTLVLDCAESGGPNLDGGEGCAMVWNIPGNTDVSYRGAVIKGVRATGSDSLNFTNIVFDNNQNADLTETLTTSMTIAYTGFVVAHTGIEMNSVDSKVRWSSAAGTPEGAVIADIGSMFTRTDGGAGTTLYVKESGNGISTGWIAK